VCAVVVLCSNEGEDRQLLCFAATEEKREKVRNGLVLGPRTLGTTVDYRAFGTKNWRVGRRRQSSLRLVSDQGKELSQLLLQVPLFVKNIV
jgi:hypothetical protein